MTQMRVVEGTERLDASVGRLYAVVGVFDGLHRGHDYLLGELRRAAAAHEARPAVITFDHHPDEILKGAAPPLLCDPAERLERLAAAGVEVTVIETFDRALRETPYDAWVGRIADRVELAGFLMTPESAFGYERRGTPRFGGSPGTRPRLRRRGRVAVHPRRPARAELGHPRARSRPATSPEPNGCSGGPIPWRGVWTRP